METKDKVYQAFYESQKDTLYFNQLKELTKLSNSSLQNILRKMTKQKILEIEKTKSNTFYKIKNKKIFSLKFCEIAIEKFNSLNVNVKNPLINFIKNLPLDIYTIILFGSASRKKEKEESDIDLLIVSNKKIDLSKNKKQAELTSLYPVSLFQTTPEDFIKNKDPVIIQARKTGFPIYREQNFFEVILNEYF